MGKQENNFNEKYLEEYRKAVSNGIAPKYLIMDKDTYIEFNKWCQEVSGRGKELNELEVRTFQSLKICKLVDEKEKIFEVR